MSKDKILSDAPSKVTVRSTSTDQQEIVPNQRKSLKTLQRVATDKENLTGRPAVHASKEAIIKEVQIEIKDKKDLKRKKLPNKEKSIQTGRDYKISIEDLTSDAGPSENYWQVLAEKRGIALTEALEENKKLLEKIDALEEENRLCKTMIDETKSMVEVLTEMIGEQDESGIDVREASTFSVVEDSTENGLDHSSNE